MEGDDELVQPGVDEGELPAIRKLQASRGRGPGSGGDGGKVGGR